MKYNFLKYYKIIILLLFTVMLIFINSYLWFNGLYSYMYALKLESRWSGKVKTQAELEKILYDVPIFITSKKNINNERADEISYYYKIRENEHMVEYTILFYSNLHVIYDEFNNVIETQTTYE